MTRTNASSRLGKQILTIAACLALGLSVAACGDDGGDGGGSGGSGGAGGSGGSGGSGGAGGTGGAGGSGAVDASTTDASGGSADASIIDGGASTLDADTGPFPGAMFVRGSFNNFDTSAPLNYDGVLYTTAIALDAGTYQFKIADTSFSDTATYSANAMRSDEIQLDAPTQFVIATGLGNDTRLRISTAGTYRFAVEVSAATLATPTVTVTEVP